MTRAGDKILAGARDALAIVRGERDAASVHVPREIDTTRMREKLNLTQEAFAARFGIPVATLRDWEHGRRMPDAATRVLLVTIDTHPDVVANAAKATVNVAQPKAAPSAKVGAKAAPTRSAAKTAAKKIGPRKRARAPKRVREYG